MSWSWLFSQASGPSKAGLASACLISTRLSGGSPRADVSTAQSRAIRRMASSAMAEPWALWTSVARQAIAKQSAERGRTCAGHGRGRRPRVSRPCDTGLQIRHSRPLPPSRRVNPPARQRAMVCRQTMRGGVHPASVFRQMILWVLPFAVARELISNPCAPLVRAPWRGWREGCRRPMVVHRARRPTAAPSGSCRCLGPASRPGCRRQRSRPPPAHAAQWPQPAAPAMQWICRPNPPALSDPDQGLRGRRSGFAGREADGRHIC